MLLCRDRKTVRHAEVSHAIEECTFEQYFGELILQFPRLQFVIADRFVPKDTGCRQTPLMIAALLFPLFPPDSSNLAQVFIPQMSRSFRIAVLPNLRSGAWRNRRFRSDLLNRAVALALVVRAIRTHLPDLFRLQAAQ